MRNAKQGNDLKVRVLWLKEVNRRAMLSCVSDFLEHNLETLVKLISQMIYSAGKSFSLVM